MKNIFSTPVDKLYTIATIIVMGMIVFPPVYMVSNDGSIFLGYEFVFDLSRSRLIDLGRLSLQLIALGAIVITIKRAITKA